MREIRETAVTIDYDEGVTLVDTTQQRVATYLKRRGFTETTKSSSAPYRRFRRETVSLAFPNRTGKPPSEKAQLALKNMLNERKRKAQ